MKEMAESWLSAKDHNKIPLNATIARTIKPQNSQQSHQFPLIFWLLVCIYRCCNSQQVITSYEVPKLHIEVAPDTSMIHLFTGVFGKQYGLVLIITSRIKPEIIEHVVHSFL